MLPKIEVRGLTKSINGAVVFSDLSFQLYAGEIVSVVGPNGSGKSTLLDIMGGYLLPDSGEVYYGATAIRKRRPHQVARLGVARTFQGGEAWSSLTLLQVVALRAAGVGWRRALSRPSTIQRYDLTSLMLWLDRFDFEEEANRPLNVLSPGQRKIAQIILVASSNARYLLFDEPLAAIDDDHRDQVSGALSLFREDNRCVLIVDHDLDWLRKQTNRTIALSDLRA